MRVARTQDAGFALMAVMGAIALITAVALGGYFLSINVMGETERVQAETRAFQTAQSGLDRELAVFNPVNLDSGYYPRQGSTPDGQYTIELETIGAGGYQYLMRSTGTAGGSDESVAMRFYYLSLWDMNIGAGEAASIQGGSGWNGQGTIEGPLYTRGDVNLGANSHFEEGPMFIFDGDLIFNSGAAGLGEQGDVDVFTTGSIIGGGKDVHLGTVSSSVPDIVLPWIDEEYMDEKLKIAIEESIDNNMGSASRTLSNIECDSSDPLTYETASALAGPRIRVPGASDYYKFYGSGTSRDAFAAGTHDLTIGSISFGAWDDGTGAKYPANSGLHDDFAFDASTGTIYIEGTVFIDGNLTLEDNVERYIGNGTLVVNGEVIILGYLAPANGISTEQALGICTPLGVDIGPRQGGDNASFTGAIFANGEVGLWGGASSVHGSWYEGSILCGNIYGDQPNMILRTDPTGMLSEVIPESMPAAGGGMVFSGTWTRQ